MIDRRAAALAFYGPLLDAPDAARRVGWDGPDGHRLRLAAIADAALAHAPDTILDAGAGEGALLPVLRGLGFAGRYLGEDVLPAMITRATSEHAADLAAAFAVADAFQPGGPAAQAVVCSGALNTFVALDHDAEVAGALEVLWGRAERVLVVDLAVRDRHPDGVGLARADLAKVWAKARELAPVVLVREDVVPGEALLVLARGRAAAWSRWLPDALARAGLLVDAGEGQAALALVADDARPAAALVRGRALAADNDRTRARAELERAAAEGDGPISRRARLELAPLFFRAGDKARAEAILRELAAGAPAGATPGDAAHADDARAHLAMLLSGRGAHDEAQAVARAITDPWIGREIMAHLTTARAMAKPGRSS